MQNTIFYWGWQNYKPTIDSSMTRARMARLMRAWRRSKIQGAHNFDFKCVDRAPNARAYTVTTRGYLPEDAAKIIVITGKNNAQN